MNTSSWATTARSRTTRGSGRRVRSFPARCCWASRSSSICRVRSSRSRSSVGRFAGFPILVGFVTFDRGASARRDEPRTDDPATGRGPIRKVRGEAPEAGIRSSPTPPWPRRDRGKGTRDDGTDHPPLSPLKPAASGHPPPQLEARPKEGYRDTVEAIVVAFILALVVRGFEAQAFVIPTGSMAPTLMGRHKEVACPQCGFVYAVNASQEVESQSRARGRRRRASAPTADIRRRPGSRRPASRGTASSS